MVIDIKSAEDRTCMKYDLNNFSYNLSRTSGRKEASSNVGTFFDIFVDGNKCMSSSRTSALPWRGLRPNNPDGYAGGSVRYW
jgi:hypothetical protein